MPIPAIAAMAARGATYGVQASSAISKSGALSNAFPEYKALGDVTKKAGDSAKSTTAATKSLVQSFEQFRNSARKGAVDFYIAKAALEGLSGKAVALMTAPIDTLAKLAEPLVNLVALSNPARAELFGWAMKDAYAVMGRIVTGPLESFTRLMRRLGDVYAKMEPILTPTVNAFGKMAETIGNQLLSAVERSGPLIAGIATSFELLTAAILPNKFAIESMVAALEMSTGLFQLIGRLSGRKAKDDASGFGAAVRPVGISQNAEDISRQSQAKAFQLAMGAKKDPAEEQVDVLTKIYNAIISPETYKNIGAAIAGVLPGVPGKETVTNFATESFNRQPLLQLLRSFATR